MSSPHGDPSCLCQNANPPLLGGSLVGVGVAASLNTPTTYVVVRCVEAPRLLVRSTTTQVSITELYTWHVLGPYLPIASASLAIYGSHRLI